MIVLTDNGITEMETAIKKARILNQTVYEAAMRMATITEEGLYAKQIFDMMEKRLDAIEQVFVNIMEGRYA